MGYRGTNRGGRICRRTRGHGQAMLEFAVAAGVVLSALAVLALLLFTFREQGSRVLYLVGSEYP